MTPHALKLIVLDRAGTINEDRDEFVKSADEFVPLPGALDAIAPRGEVWDLLSGYPAAYLLEPGDVRGISDRLRQEVERHVAGSGVCFDGWSGKTHHRRYQAGQLADVLNSLTTGGG